MSELMDREWARVNAKWAKRWWAIGLGGVIVFSSVALAFGGLMNFLLFMVGCVFVAGCCANAAGLEARKTPTTSEPYLSDLAKFQADVMLLEDVLGSVWLYIDWRYVTKQLTTEEKERFADAVDRHSERLNDDIYGEGDEPVVTDRWWR